MTPSPPTPASAARPAVDAGGRLTVANRHFGKAADVWKHLPLLEILSIERPRQDWESHAGSAEYTWVDDHERRYGAR